MIDSIQAMLQTALQPIDPTTDRLTIRIKGKQHHGDGRPKRDRTINITLSETQTQDFLRNPTLDALWNAYGAYLGDGVTDDGEQSIVIESITATSPS